MLHVRPIHLALALLAALAVLLVPFVAFAQTAPVMPAAAPALSVGTIVVLALTFVLGAAKQAQSTGKIFGQFTLPAAADVVVGLVVPFLGASLQYLATVAFSGAACAYAAFAGLAAVTSATAGALAVHAHLTMPAQMRAAKKAGTIVALAGVAVLAMMLSGCTLFRSASGSTVVNDVGSIAACVIQHVESDADPTFETIAAECSGIAIADVVQIVTALTVTPDAGAAPATKALKVHHAGSKPTAANDQMRDWDERFGGGAL